MANGLYEGSAAQAIGEMLGSAVDTIAEGFRNPVPQSVKDQTAELAARQGIQVPNQQVVGAGPNVPVSPQQAQANQAATSVQIPGLQPQFPAAPAQAPQVAEPAQVLVEQPVAQAQDPMQSILGEQQGLINKQKAVNTSLAEAGAQKAQFDAAKQRELAAQYEQDLITQQARAVERQKQVDGYIADIERSSQDYQRFLASPEAKVKTNNLWEQMGTGQKVLAGISLALGALGAGNTGKNSAVEIIQTAINNDIDAQKNNIKLQAEGKLQNYNMANNLYAQMLRKYQNEDMAEAATRLLRNQQVQMQLNAMASDYTGTQVRKQAEAANLALDQSSLQLKQQFAAAAQQQALMRELGMSREALAVGSLPKEMQDKYVPGYGFASSSGNAQEFQKVRAGAEPVLNAIDRVSGLLDNYNRVTDLKKRAQIETELKALAGALRLPITGPGALTDDEYKRLRDTIGNPSALLAMPKIERAKMLQIKNKISSDLDASAAQYGLPRKNLNIPLKTLGKPQ